MKKYFLLFIAFILINVSFARTKNFTLYISNATNSDIEYRLRAVRGVSCDSEVYINHTLTLGDKFCESPSEIKFNVAAGSTQQIALIQHEIGYGRAAFVELRRMDEKNGLDFILDNVTFTDANTHQLEMHRKGQNNLRPIQDQKWGNSTAKWDLFENVYRVKWQAEEVYKVGKNDQAVYHYTNNGINITVEERD